MVFFSEKLDCNNIWSHDFFFFLFLSWNCGMWVSEYRFFLKENFWQVIELWQGGAKWELGAQLSPLLSILTAVCSFVNSSFWSEVIGFCLYIFISFCEACVKGNVLKEDSDCLSKRASTVCCQLLGCASILNVACGPVEWESTRAGSPSGDLIMPATKKSCSNM